MYESLNIEQKQIVQSSGNILVTACPGSGKTRTLIHKIAYELDQCKDNSKMIAAITYTNAAADEIESRIEKMGIKSEQLWTGTIHAFCLEWILRPYAGYCNRLKQGFTVIDEYTANKIKEEICRKFNANIYDTNTKANRKGKLLNSNDNNKKAASEYHKFLNENKYIDFDLIMYLSYKILVSYPRICSCMGNIFRMICVDEYQDTQDIAYGILGCIFRASVNKPMAFIVGDVDQAIYGGLGGVAKSKKELEEEFGNIEFEEKTISGCYRSCQTIVDLYSNFQLNQYKISSLGNNKDDRGTICFNKAIDREELYNYIAQIVQENLVKGIAPNQICIIAPRWEIVIPCARSLNTALKDIEFDAPGLSPLGRNHDNIFFKIARLFLTEPSPNMINTRIRWAKEIIYQLALNYDINFEEDEISPLKLLKLINSIQCTEKEGIEYLKNVFDQLLGKLNIELNRNSSLYEQYSALIEKVMNNQKKEGISTDIGTYRKIFSKKKGIVINTCHGVKGEEYETVIAFGLLNGYIPNWKDIYMGEEKKISASNKLLYVICSRAKKNLYLIAEKGRFTAQKRPYLVNNELNSVVFDYDDK